MTTLELLALALKERSPGPVDLGGTMLWWDGERVQPERPDPPTNDQE